MPTTAGKPGLPPRPQQGVTLVELIVFIVVISLALGALIGVYRSAVLSSVDPIVRLRLLESAQSQLDVIMAQRYDDNTPPGGVPACGSTAPPGNPEPPPCANTGFNSTSDTPYDGYTREVSVEFAGEELGLPEQQAKRIQVTTTSPAGESLTLTAYRANF